MVVLVPASVADIESILPVMAEAFPPEFGEAWSAAQCASMLSLPNCHFLIARHVDRVVGFAIWRVVLTEAELLLIAIDPECHGQGMGSALLHHVVTESSLCGAQKLYVEVRSDNGARSFYIKRGFTEVGVRPNYYRRTDFGPADAITLARNIEH